MNNIALIKDNKNDIINKLEDIINTVTMNIL